ncbi:hypothetical protein B0H12DRAFT_1139739 [Mycena haematopus]|nr:hypothetical protein B0H12DRAFT_1139739 [Mycena haematopus]
MCLVIVIISHKSSEYQWIFMAPDQACTDCLSLAVACCGAVNGLTGRPIETLSTLYELVCARSSNQYSGLSSTQFLSVAGANIALRSTIRPSTILLLDNVKST